MADPMSPERLRTRAKRVLPRIVFDFIEGGAEDELTLRRNGEAFQDLCLVPRVLRGVREVSTETELFGQRLSLPVLLAPAGNARVAGPQGELAQIKGASAAGTIGVLGGFASISAERVSTSVPEPHWFQLYLFRERALTLEVVERVKGLGFAALVVTVDTPIAGNRERDKRNGLVVPLRIGPRMIADAARRPRWLWHYLTGEPMSPHIEGALKATGTALGQLKSHAEYVHSVLNTEQSWAEVEWLRSVWDGPLLVKGILCEEDAELAVAARCDGLIVSNHGGRQLDGAPASIEALPEIVMAVDGRAEVLVDGGIRRGTDVVKALALGAKACLVGRPWLYGLAVGGEQGVVEMLAQLRAEITRTLQLMGLSSLDQLGPQAVRRRPGAGWERLPRR
jgi:(S)-mandelate dehydrogenase